jgi:SOS-response transcriptional repressor LexA
VIDVVDIPVAWEGHYAAYQVTGDSMAPDIPDGARVVVRVQDYASPGNEIVVWVPDHGMLVKRLERITPDGELVLTSYNPEFKPIWARDVRIYGVVVEVRLRRKVINGNHGPN